jgi:hypothetical protein
VFRVVPDDPRRSLRRPFGAREHSHDDGSPKGGAR